jgi:hypothetical protein
LDVGGRLDLFRHVAESVGGTPAMLAAVVSSIWTSVALIAGGIGYIVFVGEPKQGVQRHYLLPYVGWALFVIACLSMMGVIGEGAAELYIRQNCQAAEGNKGAET